MVGVEIAIAPDILQRVPYFGSYRVSLEVTQHTSKRRERVSQHQRQLVVVGVLSRIEVEVGDLALNPAQGLVADIASPRLDVSAEERETPMDFGDACFALVEGESEFIAQKLSDMRDKVPKPHNVGSDDEEIVDIAAIVSAEELPFHELVEDVEVDVTEELACEVADGQAAAVGAVEKTFIVWERMPLVRLPYDYAIFDGVEQDEFLREIADEIHIDMRAAMALVESGEADV